MLCVLIAGRRPVLDFQKPRVSAHALPMAGLRIEAGTTLTRSGDSSRNTLAAMERNMHPGRVAYELAFWIYTSQHVFEDIFTANWWRPMLHIIVRNSLKRPEISALTIKTPH